MAGEPFRGCYTVLITPFTEDGAAVDLKALERLVEFQVAEGIRGLIPLGSTGEFLSVSREERTAVVETVVRAARDASARLGRDRVPVLIGSAAFDEERDQGVAFVLDLTEQKRAEAEARESERRYREMQMEVAHANRVATMGQLTASIAHEVNQPIAAAATTPWPTMAPTTSATRPSGSWMTSYQSPPAVSSARPGAYRAAQSRPGTSSAGVVSMCRCSVSAMWWSRS